MAQKIIKLTESQLRDIVYKVINEQPAAPTSIGNQGQLQVGTAPTQSKLSCVDFKGKDHVGYVAPSFQTGNGGTLSYGKDQLLAVYSNGRYFIAKNGATVDKGGVSCSSSSGILELTSDTTGGYKMYFNYTKTQPTTTPNTTAQKPSWVKNEKSPYKLGQMGENIKMMQEKLGVKPDGYFGKATEDAVLKFNPQYKKEIGVDQSTFEKIMGGSGMKLQQQTGVTQKDLNAPPTNPATFGTNYGNFKTGTVNK